MKIEDGEWIKKNLFVWFTRKQFSFYKSPPPKKKKKKKLIAIIRKGLSHTVQNIMNQS